MHNSEGDSEILLTGSRVYTADPINPWAEAVLIRGNRLAFVGREADARALAGSAAEHIHTSGGLVLPGFNESHVHMTLGSHALGILNLAGALTFAAMEDRLRDYAARHPEKPWIEAYGLPYEPLSGLSVPPCKALDTIIPDRPVILNAIDYHSSWINSAALQLAGIERGAELPLPNEVVVDADGFATGMLKERLAHDCVLRHIAEPTEAQKDDALRRAMQYLNSLGITSVQNMDGDLERLLQYERLRGRGELSVRASHYLNIRRAAHRDRLPEFAELTRKYSDDWNFTNGIKLFIDGVVEAKTALMLEGYSDGSGETGVPDMELEAYHDIVVEADRLNIDVATHAIGDRGVRLTLDAYEDAQRAHGGSRNRRHRVEHIEVGNPTDIPRFARLGVTASMQPYHAVPGVDPDVATWAKMVGAARVPYAFPWRRLLEAGAAMSFGSDWPVVTPDVRDGLRAAVARECVVNADSGGWQPQQCVSLAQALDAYTSGGAYAEHREQSKGKLTAGFLADVTVLGGNLFKLRPSEYVAVPVQLTILDGRVVHRAG
jgi:predicted amidohydrolase YtcJ